MAEIELTEAQSKALQAEQGKPVVVDLSTRKRYVLIAQEQFERVKSQLDEPTNMLDPQPSVGITKQMLQSQKAFWRDLPELLKHKSRRDRYVAYHGNERIGFGRTLTELSQECLRRGLARGEFYVGLLEEREMPPWVSAPLAQSLFESDGLSSSAPEASSK